LDKSALEEIFPGVSVVMKNDKSAGKNYVFTTSDEDLFMNFLTKYQTFFE
jgi:hypothetical protein